MLKMCVIHTLKVNNLEKKNMKCVFDIKPLKIVFGKMNFSIF